MGSAKRDPKPFNRGAHQIVPLVGGFMKESMKNGAVNHGIDTDRGAGYTEILIRIVDRMCTMYGEVNIEVFGNGRISISAGKEARS